MDRRSARERKDFDEADAGSRGAHGLFLERGLEYDRTERNGSPTITSSLGVLSSTIGPVRPHRAGAIGILCCLGAPTGQISLGLTSLKKLNPVPAWFLDIADKVRALLPELRATQNTTT